MTIGKILSVFNPADKNLIKELNLMSPFELEVAVTNASEAFNEWKLVSRKARAEFLTKIASTIREQKEALAKLLTLEQGKPLAESRLEIDLSANYFEWYAHQVVISRDYTDQLEGGRFRVVTHHPLGVCAAITPWNFPSAMIARKVSAAIAAGCSIIVKPAPDTPLSALEYQRIFEECDAPTGLVQVIIAEAEDASKVFFRRNQVRKISFTGSTAVGKELMQKASTQVKRLTLELGGNAPCIVLKDADIEIAVRESFFAKFRNCGQTCIAVNRILLEAEIFQSFAEKFITKVKQIKVGEGSDPESTLGPLINRSQFEKVTRLVDDAIASGAEILYDGRSEKSFERLKDKGYFYAPIVLRGMIGVHQLWAEEIFGPVAVLYEIPSSEDGDLSSIIHHANDTRAGLVAYCFTSDKKKAEILQESLEFGMIGMNDCRITAVETPFGGIKESGFGIEGGKEGLFEYEYTSTTVLGAS